ncbi:MAG: hypothetical protein ACE5LC_00255 [Candidatus Aminicenantales bacterium]
MSRALADNPDSAYQETPVKKQRYDYMSTLFSRNAKSLGLKIDPDVQRLINQPHIKWAIRAEERHILR